MGNHIKCFRRANWAQQNLKENGGLLDEVLFVTKTTNVEDLEWLDRLIPTSESYKKRILPDPGINFGMTWEGGIFERGKMYLKIDDDVVSPPSPQQCRSFSFPALAVFLSLSMEKASNTSP